MLHLVVVLSMNYLTEAGGIVMGRRSLLLSIVIAIAPLHLKIALLKAFRHARIGRGVRIGISILDASEISIGDGCRIGHLNYVKGLRKFEMGSDASIGNLNRVTGVFGREETYYPLAEKPKSDFSVGTGASITSRHFFDCSDTIEIGAKTVIAGMGSQFWTHGIDIETGQQFTTPIEIGDCCLVGSSVVFVKGSSIPSCCVVGAGSLVRRKFAKSYMVIAGNPANERKHLDPSGLYFRR